MPNHKDEIEAKAEAEAQRATKLMNGLAKRAYKTAEREGYHNFKFETIGIVAVVTWDDGSESDDIFEDVAGSFESKRRYVQTGILADALLSHVSSVFFSTNDKGDE